MASKIRKRTYSIDEISNMKFKYKNKHKQKLITHDDGLDISITKMHHDLFIIQKKIKCERCSLEGGYFALEKEKHEHIKVYHLNLYAIKNGKEVLMTKDHIIPISEKGSNKPENIRTLCKPCNNIRSNSPQEKIKDNVFKNFYNYGLKLIFTSKLRYILQYFKRKRSQKLNKKGKRNVK